MSSIQISCALLVPLLWGYQFVAIKLGLAEFPPLFFLGLRFLAMALLLIPFVARPSLKQLIPVFAISVFLSALNFGLFYVGLGLGTGTMTAVAYQLATPFIVLLSWPMLGERPSLRTATGVLIAFLGVVAASGGIAVTTEATVLVVAAALAYAIGNVLTKQYGPFDPLMLVAWMSLFTIPQILIASFVLEHGQWDLIVAATLSGWLALGYTVVVGGVIGFGLWFWLIAHCSMARIAPFGLLMPIFATAASVMFLGEHLTPALVGSGLLTVAGVAMTQRKPAGKPA